MDVNQIRCIGCGRPLDTTVAGDQCLACLLTLATESAELNLDLVDGDDSIARDGVPKRIGDYELQAELARGGMGAVFRARQISLNRLVAIKMMIAGQLASPDLVRRFYIEAEAAASLDHPNIVPIYEVGESETLHFISMKLIDGRDLSQLMESHSLVGEFSSVELRQRQRLVANVMLRIADALAYAHSHGVLHRDIKPSNILIDAEGEPHLTDFGLAKLTEDAGTRLTLTSSIMGSPSYMAPEQTLGDSSQITTRTDVYSVGAVLFELLTGRPPFLGKTAVETIRRVNEQLPPRPRSLNGNSHPDLETIALRCLEKEPHRRYASAEDVRLELQRFLQGESILARPVGPMQELWRWAKRNRRVAITALMLLIALLVGTTGIAWQARRATIANRELAETVSYLKWAQITELVKQEQIQEAVARLAAVLRSDPHNQQAAAYTTSVLDQSKYYVPIEDRIRHSGNAEITVAEFAPSEDFLATGGRDCSVCIWSLDDYSLAIDPIVMESSIENLSFSFDGELLAISTSNGTLCVRRFPFVNDVFRQSFEQPIKHLKFARSSNILCFTERSNLCRIQPELGEPLQCFDLNTGFDSLALSSDGERAVALLQDRTVRVWETSTGKQLFSIDNARPVDAAISSSGQRVAISESKNGSLDIWNVDSGQKLSQHSTEFGDVDHLTFVASDERIIAASRSHAWSTIYNCLSGRQCGPELKQQALVTEISPFSDSRFVMTLSKNNDLRFWNVETGRSFAQPVAIPGGIARSGVSRTGRCIWTSINEENGNRQSIQVWRLHTPKSPPDLSHNFDTYMTAGAAASPDGRWVVTSIKRGSEQEENVRTELAFVDVATGEEVRSNFEIESDALTCVFTPDIQKFVAVTVSGQIAVFSVPGFELFKGPIKSKSPIQPSRLSPDGRQLVTGSRDGWLTLWDINSLTPLWEQRHSVARLNDLCFSADGKILASCSDDATAKLWETDSGSLISELLGHEARVFHIRMDSKTQTVASGGDDSFVILWDIPTGLPRFHLPLADRVYAMDFHPRDEVLAVTSRDGRCQLWQTRTGNPISRPMNLDQIAFHNKFNNDGTQLLCAGQSGFQLWDTVSARPLTILHRQVGQWAHGVDADGYRTMFLQNQDFVFCGSRRYSSRIWNLKSPKGVVPEWFPIFLESIVKQRLNPRTGVVEQLDSSSRSEIELESQIQNHSDYANWCRQFLNRLSSPSELQSSEFAH